MGLLSHLLPPTIHPMIVHFPIAIAFLLLATEVMAMVRRSEPLYDRAGLILYVLELVSLVAAAFAGIISEQAAHPTASVRPMLEAHQRDAFLTGLAFSAGFVVRALRWLDRRRRGRLVSGPSGLSLLLQLVGTVLLVVTASLGGSMVYNHGLGVALACGAMSVMGCLHAQNMPFVLHQLSQP